jgi:hypothetical protein
MKKILTLTIAFMILGSVCEATTYYVSQNGGTFSGGAACNGQTTHPYSWLSGGGNYTAGDTVYLCGSFSSELQVGNSGTSTSQITIIFDTGASIQRPYCDTSYCFNFGGKSYVTLNGGTPCGWNTEANSSEGTCNGFIEATANGSSLANHQAGGGVVVNGTGDEVENLGIYNMYVYTNNSGIFPSGNVSWVDCTTTSGCLIHDSTVHDAGWGIEWIISSSASGPFNVYNNQIYHMSHGPTLPYGGQGGTVSGINIYGNYIHDFAWDSSGCGYHNDGIHLYGQSTGSGSVTVSANIHDNIFGGAAGSCLTAHIFEESTTQPGPGGVNIYNNLAYFTDNPVGGTGIFGLGPTSGSGTVNLYNNTIACNSAGGGPTGVLLNVADFTFKNNLLKNCSPLIWWEGGSVTADQNAYDTATCSGGGNQCFKSTSSAIYASLSSWKSATSQDSQSQGGSTNLSASYVPQSGSSAIGAGADLTSLDIGTLDMDMVGIQRAATGTCTPGVAGCWDTGAYQYSSSSSTVQPPTGLAASVQ